MPELLKVRGVFPGRVSGTCNIFTDGRTLIPFLRGICK